MKLGDHQVEASFNLSIEEIQRITYIYLSIDERASNLSWAIGFTFYATHDSCSYRDRESNYRIARSTGSATDYKY